MSVADFGRCSVASSAAPAKTSDGGVAAAHGQRHAPAPAAATLPLKVIHNPLFMQVIDLYAFLQNADIFHLTRCPLC